MASTCSFCTERSVSAHLVRLGQIPAGWRHGKHPEKTPDRSRLQVVRVCDTHRDDVPQPLRGTDHLEGKS